MMANSPETQFALDRMEAIPEHLMTGLLRPAVLDAAERAAMTRQVHQAHSDSTGAVSAALRAADVPAAMALAEELAGTERLIPMLPSTEVDSSVVAEALSSASSKLRQALAELPPVPEVLFSAEKAAWRSLGQAVLTAVDPPGALASDLDAEAARKAVEAARSGLAKGVDAWDRDSARGVDVLSLLLAAGGLLEAIASQRGPFLAAAEQVQAANEARVAAGVVWQVPRGHESGEIRHLQTLRAAVASLEVAV